jgi:hypothetical protein
MQKERLGASLVQCHAASSPLWQSAKELRFAYNSGHNSARFLSLSFTKILFKARFLVSIYLACFEMHRPPAELIVHQWHNQLRAGIFTDFLHGYKMAIHDG